MSLELKARLTLDRRGFVQGMNFSKQEVQNWNRVLERHSKQSARNVAFGWTAAWGAVAAGAVVVGKAISSALSFGGRFQDMSDRLGMDPEKLQQWNYEASLSGSSIEAIASAMQKMAVSSQAALDGNIQMETAFQKLGISIEQIENTSLEQRFELIRQGMVGARLEGEKMAAFVKVFGRGSGELIPFMKAGPLEESKLVTSNRKEIARLDAMGDELKFQKELGAKVLRNIVAGGLSGVPGAAGIWSLISSGRVEKRYKANLAALDDDEKKMIAEAEAQQTATEAAEEAREAKKRQAEEQRAAERIAAAQAEADKALESLKMSRATTPEAKIRLLRERQEIELMKNRHLLNKEDALRAGAEANRLQQEIEALQGKDAGGLRGPGDALLSIGNFLGAGFNTLGGANTAVNELKAIKQELVQIKEGQKTQKGVRLEVPA